MSETRIYLTKSQARTKVKGTDLPCKIVFFNRGSSDRREKFHEIVGNERELLINDFDQFCEDFPGVYSIDIGTKKEDSKNGKDLYSFIKMEADLSDTSDAREPSSGVSSTTDISQLKADLKNEILHDMEKEEREKQLLQREKEAKEELAEIRSHGGRMAIVVEEIIMRFMRKGPVMMPAMQGTEAPQTQATPEEIDQEQKLHEAVSILVDALGVDGVVALADKAKDPAMVTMVKQFLQIT